MSHPLQQKSLQQQINQSTVFRFKQHVKHFLALQHTKKTNKCLTFFFTLFFLSCKKIELQKWTVACYETAVCAQNSWKVLNELFSCWLFFFPARCLSFYTLRVESTLLIPLLALQIWTWQLLQAESTAVLLLFRFGPGSILFFSPSLSCFGHASNFAVREFPCSLPACYLFTVPVSSDVCLHTAHIIPHLLPRSLVITLSLLQHIRTS